MKKIFKIKNFTKFCRFVSVFACGAFTAVILETGFCAELGLFLATDCALFGLTKIVDWQTRGEDE